MASSGNALMRATDVKTAFATRSSDGGDGFTASAAGSRGRGAGASADAVCGSCGIAGSCGSATPLPASAAACCSSTFACCCNRATCSRNSATNGSICVISCAAVGSRNGSAGTCGRSTTQYGCVSSGVGGKVMSPASRPSKSGAAFSSMPAAQTCPSARASCCRPSSSRDAKDTFTVRSLSGSVARTKDVSTPPAPTWMKMRAPSAAVARSAETKSTGAVACRTHTSRSSPA